MATYTNVIQPATGEDMSISQLTPTVNDGSNTLLYASLVGVGDINRALIKFDLSGVIGARQLQPDQITSASITLYSGEAGAIKAGKAYRILAPNLSWAEFTGTWATQNGIRPWNGASGCGLAGSDYSAVALGAYDATNKSVGAERVITITSMSELIALLNNNYGIVFVADDETTINAVSIGTSSEGEAARRPKFTMVYSPTAEIANDSGFNQYDGTHVGNVEQAGSSGADYDGGYTDISSFINSGDFATGGAFTVFAQLKADSAIPATVADSAFNIGTLTADPIENAVSFRHRSNGYRFRLKTDGGDFKSLVVSPTVTDYNTLAITLDGTNYGFWLNGSSSQSGTSSTWTQAPNEAVSAIGSEGTANSRPFWGLIKNVIIGNAVAADSSEISTINTKVVAGTLTTGDLDAIFGAGDWEWWKLDEYSGIAGTRIGGNDGVTIKASGTVNIESDALKIKEVS